MRVAILTLPIHVNMGGLLQAYALQTVLEQMGHKVHILQNDYYPRIYKLNMRQIKIYAKRLIKKFVLGKSTDFYREKKIQREIQYILNETNRFCDNHLHILRISSLLDVTTNDYDAIVVGSDQIWRPLYVKISWNEEIENVFLKFAENWSIKRVAYAVSFGVDNWEFNNKQTTICKDLASIFNAISVRETSGVALCIKYLNIHPKLVLDPTLLPNKSFYLNLIKDQNQLVYDSTLFDYMLDYTPDKNEIVKKIQKDRCLSLFSEFAYERSGSITRHAWSVESWLAGIAQAKFVVTDSFHVCVFSILFGIPFIALGNKTRGMSRFESLLSMLNLTDHLITNINEYDSRKQYGIPHAAYDILNEYRQESLSFLSNAIN